jgi:hypothetical protein
MVDRCMLNRTLIVFTLIASVLSASSAYGLPGVPKYVPKAYEGKAEYQAFLAKYSALKSKCDLCHKPGADKKAKGHGLNDFGHAVHEHLDDDAFKKLDKSAKDMPEDGKQALKLLIDALQKSEADKNADGKSFGEIMKGGELPGKP